MAFADAFDISYSIKYDLQMIAKQYIPLNMYTDNLSLFNIITRSSKTTEKRLMINLRSVKQCYQNQELDNVVHVRTKFNPADAFKKVKRNNVLEKSLAHGILDHPVGQWVVRDTIPTESTSGDKEKGDCQV